jgi:hypothetical protein
MPRLWPNMGLQRTPLRVERDPSFFEDQTRLKGDPNLLVAAPLNPSR